MCGIGGVLRTDGGPIPDEWLDAIDARIAYRGPDGHGRFRDRVEVVTTEGKRVIEVAFVHRRLSIIDHASGGQPMVSERGRNDSEGLVAVVFNGCIYNHRELRRELESKGHRFVTDHSDTEVLIHGWREWGEVLPDHLEGMYACAIWDRTRAALALARDLFGEKPLYYCRSGMMSDWPAVLGFSSEAQAMFHFMPEGSEDNHLNREQWLQALLQFGYVIPDYPVAGPQYRDAFQVIPGDTWVFPSEKRKVRRSGLFKQTAASLAGEEQVELLLDRAVRRRLEADVPLGCFLSGGVDSSLVAHFAKRHKADLQTFTVRMPDPRFDESGYAEQVAQHLDVHHTTLDVGINPSDDLLHLIGLLGQPFGDSSILPTYWVSKAAREHIKVALSGDGGDELFFGYERYFAAPLLAMSHRVLSLLPSSPLQRAHHKTRIHKAARLAEMARDYSRLGVLAMESIFSQRQIEELTGEEPDPAILLRNVDDDMIALRNIDTWCYLPGDLLRKVDTASMAVGLELRCPFLDRDLACQALAAPLEQLIPHGKRKELLRKIARKHLPKGIATRRKMGFAIPIGEWFRNDFGGMKTLLLDHLESAEPFGSIQVNQTAVRRLIDEHMTGRRDHSHRLFTLLTLSIWSRGSKR